MSYVEFIVDFIFLAVITVAVGLIVLVGFLIKRDPESRKEIRKFREKEGNWTKR